MISEEKEQIDIKIGGMHCASCALNIQNTLKSKDGVIDAVVNFSTEKATIHYKKNSLSFKDIQSVIEKAGYSVLGRAQEVSHEQQEAQKQKELRMKKLRFISGFSGSAVLMFLMHFHLPLPVDHSYVMLVLTTPLFLFVSIPIFNAAFRALKNFNLTMDVMYAMGIGIAYTASVLGTFQIIISREFLLYETTLMLASFLMLGRYLEGRAKGKTSAAIQKLIGFQPKTATVIRNDIEQNISIHDVIKGDRVIIKPGERIPVDGVVRKGSSYVDESMITGEPLPRKKSIDEKVIGGTINKNSVLTIETTAIGEESMLAQIIQLVEKAQNSRPQVQKLADKVVSIFIPVVFSVALLSFFLWIFVAGSTLYFALSTFIAVLVIACPCALGLATPTAVTVGMGRAAELGILIKNTEVIERINTLTTVIFDKTGTLTQGKPQITDIIPVNVTQEELVSCTLAVEKNSSHPLAQAIVTHLSSSQPSAPPAVEQFDTIEGMGVTAFIEQSEIAVGSESLLKKLSVPVPEEIQNTVRELEKEAKTLVFVAKNKKLVGLFGITDPIKQNSLDGVSMLRSMGLKVGIITGDTQQTANAIARQIGIDSVIANVLPQDKAQAVQTLQKNGETVAFVGDGINDAPALAQADIGIALGSGTDVAIESGSIVLMKDDIRDVATAFQLSNKIMTRIKQNLFWAFAYNTILIPVAAGVLYPLWKITFRPEFGGLAMALSSVTVVSLSLLLKRFTPPARQP